MDPANEEVQLSAMTMAVDELLTAIVLPDHTNCDFIVSPGSDRGSQDSHPIKYHLNRIANLLAASPPRSLDINEGGEAIGPIRASRSCAFTFEAPESVQAIGSLCHRTVPITHHHELDIAIQLPSSILQAKDYLDRRYFIRRSLFLNHVRDLLSSDYECDMITYPDNPLFPTIRLSNKAPIAEGKYWKVSGRPFHCINIVTMVAPNVFIPRRLAPQRNALRLPDPDIATPLYNQEVLHEMYRSEHIRWLREWQSLCPNLVLATNLVKIWSRRRSLNVSGFVFEMMLAYLHEIGRIISAMNPFQMFRALLIFLKEVDLAKGVSVEPPSDEMTNEGFGLSAFSSVFPVTFVASCNRCNILYRMKLVTYRRIVHEAILSLAPENTFSNLFIVDCSPSLAFDAHIRIRLPESLVTSFAAVAADRSSVHAAADHVLSIITRSLSDRISLIDVVDVDFTSNVVRFGIIFDAAEASRTMDKGPSAEFKSEAAMFRQFWGPICTLRRFRDGSICEAVVWPDESEHRHHSQVIHDIVVHILSLHVKIPQEAISIIASKDVDVGGAIPLNSYHLESPISTCSQAYDKLCKTLRGLSDLPISILNISSSDPCFRSCSAFDPAPYNANRHAENDPMIHNDLIRVVVQFESSAKWPEDLTAIARIKTALFIRMASLLQEEGIASTAFSSYIIVWCENIAFRIDVYHPREIAIRRAEVGYPGVTKTMDVEENARELALMELDLIQRPMMATELRSLTQRFPVMAPAIRLAKRWVNAHLMGSEFSHEAIELIVAHVFLHPLPFTSPASTLSAFVRFLHLISVHDWKKVPLVLDLHGDLQVEQLAQIQTLFANPSSNGVMRVATFRDLSSNMWKSPSDQVLSRLVVIAKSSLSHIKGLIDCPLPPKPSSWRTAFHTPIAKFDIFIRLQPKYVPHHDHCLLPNKKAPLSSRRKFKGAVPPSDVVRHKVQSCSAGVNPVQLYLDTLRSAFTGLATFYYDNMGSDVIVAKLKVDRHQRKRVRLGKTCMNYMYPIDVNHVAINLEEVCHDISRLGEGLVMNVYTDVNQYRSAI